MDDARPLAAGPPDTHRADPLGQVRRHWWLVVLLAAAGLGAASQVTDWLPMVYEASTSVMVEPTSGGQGTGAGRGPEINLDTEAQLVTSTAVATGAASLLHSTAPPAALVADVSVQVPPNTSVLVIAFDAAHARDAQAGSRAFAQAYLRNRADSARADIAGRVAVLTDKLNQLNTSLAQVNAGIGARSPDRADLDTQRSTIVSQINTLTSELDDLSTTTVEAGQVIQDADLPTTPVQPDRLLNLACGLLAGLVLGTGGALGRERLGRRVYAANALRRVDVPVIANIPVRGYALDAAFPPGGTAGRAFDRLRNEVVARMPAAVRPIRRPALTAASPRAGGDPAGARPAPSGQTIVVTGASSGVASAVVAANLAAAFARTGAETVVVSARHDDSPTGVTSLDRALGVHARPGLSDVLDGQVSLRRAIQRAPGHPCLHVVAAGERGLVQSPALPDILATLRARAEYVVVEAPSTATSADAQSLASLADAALVAVELRRTRYAEVRDAADQLRRIGTPLLGVVAVARLTGSS
jgi:Mrp family chromosome partitioning ATPase/capsular polysaccharide biosynthesis protein